jgi:S-adenosylmethionine decarboxylase proenzyme
MFTNHITSGKHLIADIRNIKNFDLLTNINKFKQIFDDICKENDFIILKKIEYLFEPNSFSVIYLLSESHISVHTFPEKKYCSIDLYCCRVYENDDVYNKIYNYFITKLNADKSTPIIIDRYF